MQFSNLFALTFENFWKSDDGQNTFVVLIDLDIQFNICQFDYINSWVKIRRIIIFHAIFQSVCFNMWKFLKNRWSRAKCIIVVKLFNFVGIRVILKV